MPVELVTKGPQLSADDARLDGMDSLNPLSITDNDPIDEERLKKISHLKQAIANGTYHVSAEQLADKLIEHMLEPKG